MAFFKKLKNNIGIEEDTEEGIEVKPKKIAPKRKTEAKEPEATEEKASNPTKENGKKEEKKGKNSASSKNKEAADWLQSKGQLAVDVFQTENNFCVQAPIAGVNQEDIDISVENDMLIIKGVRKEPDKDGERKYFYQECYWGPFSRQIILPEDVNIQKIQASLKGGILVVKVPIIKPTKKKVVIEIE